MQVETVVNTQVLFFGSLAEQLGRQAAVELPPEGCTVAELRRLLAERGENGAALLRPGVRASVDQESVRDEDVVRPGQEISFFPIVSGG